MAHAYAKVSEPCDICQHSSLATAPGETQSGHLGMSFHRTPRRLGDEVTTRPHTATAEAMERPVLDRSENEVGHEGEQRRAAVCTVSDPGKETEES